MGIDGWSYAEKTENRSFTFSGKEIKLEMSRKDGKITTSIILVDDEGPAFKLILNPIKKSLTFNLRVI